MRYDGGVKRDRSQADGGGQLLDLDDIAAAMARRQGGRSLGAPTLPDEP
jgi:hypothetical protein